MNRWSLYYSEFNITATIPMTPLQMNCDPLAGHSSDLLRFSFHPDIK